MKHWIVAYFIAGIAFAAAQSAADSANSAPAEPLSTTSPDNTRYLANPDLLTACQARLNALGDRPCSILFIGDSATAGWLKAGKDIWTRTYQPRQALNFGVEGDKIQNVLWRLSTMPVQNLAPKVVVLLIGANNTANTTHQIADGIKSVIVTLQSTIPGVKIILVSILPNEHLLDKLKPTNSLIRSLADGGTVYYLDLAAKMPSAVVTNVDGKPEAGFIGIGPDHLNPDAKGYQIWADTMEPLLTKLLSTDK